MVYAAAERLAAWAAMEQGDSLLLNLDDPDGGLWYEIAAENFEHRPALFLDRDGVIVEDTHYLSRPEDVSVLSGACAAVARCNQLGIPVVLVTNQSGIGRSFYDWRAFHAVQAVLGASLATGGARLDAVFACAHHAEGHAPFNIADHPWRKPNPGMILTAGHQMKLDLPHSWIVGDRASDIAAGRAAGLEGGILVSSNTNDPEWQAVTGLKAEGFALEASTSLEEAVLHLLAHGRLGSQLPAQPR